MTASARAAVTGFCAAHPRLQSALPGWTEYSAARTPDLPALFSAEHPPNQIKRGTPEEWWERFLACGIIGELHAAGLWQDGAWSIDPSRVGVCFSSSKGRPAWLEDKQQYSFSQACDWALVEISKRLGISGKRMCPVAACASGAHAIAIAAQWIEDGACDVVVCGGVEAQIASLMLAGYRQLGALSTSGVMRPFDKARDGFVPAAGAACLILENENLACARGAKMQGRVAGWSLRCDATSLTVMEPSGETIARAIDNAVPGASTPANVDYINAHATATQQGDALEAKALRRVFGNHVAVSSTKSLTGHLLGAAGATEAVLCFLAMQQNFAPPTLNLKEVDSNCVGLDLVTGVGRDMEIRRALSLSYGFGGHIGVLLLEKD